MSLRELMHNGILYLDGGMGTLLQAGGMEPGEAPERWGLQHPDQITVIHRSYFDAGSHLVLANTFGCSPLKYDADTLEKMVGNAVACARKAAEESTSSQEKYVALDIGPTGQLLKPFGPLPFEEAVSAFAQVVRIGVSHGVDCIFIETMNDSYETKAAVLAAKENADCPVLVSNAYGADGKLMTGAPPEAMVAMLEGLGVDALGVNCSLGPDSLRDVVMRYLKTASIPVLMKPNAGLPVVENGITRYPMEPERFAELMAPLIQEGLRIVGGCCGTTPAYIRALRQKTGRLQPPPLTEKTETLVSSRSRCIRFEDRPLLIGERINPTGKKRFKQALMEGDIPYILSEGIAQEERGADLLDVNVGIPDIDEEAMLTCVVEELQAITDLPLQLDTANPAAMAQALRRYNGKAMINSVNGREEVMEAVFPLARKYGGVLVALTLDEHGIPDTAQGRLAIAKKILQQAEAFGIQRKDLVFDPLTMTVSTDGRAALTTLEAVRLIREETGCATVLGVSNISFGLPAREVIGHSFFLMALQAGLSAAIMNPKSDAMMGAYHSFLALSNLDENCASYVAFASGLPAMQAVSGTPDRKKPDAPQGEKGLRYAVTKGLKLEASRYAADALAAGADPMALVNQEILPALDDVGRGFEEKTVFLPQLMMSAEAAESAFGEIKRCARSGTRQSHRCTIVLATVRGDVHDIGKNIVRLLLENYGFDVRDLGRDVPPETIVDEVKALHAPICGLSALMTTTVPAMEETIQRLHNEAPWCRIMVGGAVLTASYAERIHADAYAKDAMAAVRCAERLEQASAEVREDGER